MTLLSYIEKSQNRRRLRFLLLGTGAILCGICLVTQSLDIIQWISLVPAIIALIDISRDARMRKRGMYGYGFFFFFCFYAVSFHWFVGLYPLEFIDGMTWISALFVVFLGCFGLSALQSFGAAVIFILFSRLYKKEFFKNSVLIQASFLAGAWTVLEWSQTIGWVGVPWARLAIGQTGLLLGAQTSSFFGCCFVTFLIVFVNYLAASAVLYSEKRRAVSFVAALTVLLNFSVGAIIYNRDTDNGAPIKAAVIQGNISSADKWNVMQSQRILSTYEKLTKEAANEGASIVVLPETALPYNITDNIPLLEYSSRLARENEITLLVGAFTYEGDDEYNSIVTFMPDGRIHENVYSKRHLVPFGEYVPYRAFFEAVLPVLTEIGMLSDDLCEGEEARILELDEINIGSLICFDSIYDALARDSANNGAEVFAISTNDSWFSDTAALSMHNAQAKLRSIENGRYTLRAANTGISSVIAPNGSCIDSLGALEEGYICAEVYAQNTRTLYSVIGNIFVYICVVWLILCVFCEKIHQIFTKRLTKKRLDDKII